MSFNLGSLIATRTQCSIVPPLDFWGPYRKLVVWVKSTSFYNLVQSWGSGEITWAQPCQAASKDLFDESLERALL